MHAWFPVLLCVTASAAVPADEAGRVAQFYVEEWEWLLKNRPTLSTAVGDRRYNDRLDDVSPEKIAANQAHAREVLAKAKTFDRAQLCPQDQVNLDLFIRRQTLTVEGQRFPGELMPLDQLNGVYNRMSDLADITPRDNVKDYEDFIKRLRDFPRLVDQNIALMQRGIARGITQPRVAIASVPGIIRNQIVNDPTQTYVYDRMFSRFPETISAADRKRLQAEGAQAIKTHFLPALSKLEKFVREDYLPKARTSIAMRDLPDGQAWYAYEVRSSTTTDLTPEEIHQIGLAEVVRINQAMRAAMDEAKFTGTLAEYFEFLRTDPRFFFATPEALVTGYRDIAKRIDPELPRLFGTLPRMPYGVKPVPAHSERTETTAYYQPGSVEAHRPGIFYCNTYNLAARPKWEMEALALHEAVPGHHLQLALAQELRDVPMFRRFAHYTAFTEGWALYAESLGQELGLYTDPHSRFGQLAGEMWRAVRLVVDTGIHAKGWTREQALAYFRKNTSKSEHDMQVEADRYIVWPAQALAYKVGQLKIRELRTFAEQSLGAQFDVRAFHDLVVGGGAVPLWLVESRVRQWVAEQLPRR
jgi:uncharacterized protein (DUF885 family)